MIIGNSFIMLNKIRFDNLYIETFFKVTIKFYMKTVNLYDIY